MEDSGQLGCVPGCLSEPQLACFSEIVVESTAACMLALATVPLVLLRV